MSPVWNIRIEGIAPLMEAYEETKDLEAAKTAILVILKRELHYEEGDDLELDECLDNLADSSTQDEFNEAWVEVYNWADKERVWIDPVK